MFSALRKGEKNAVKNAANLNSALLRCVVDAHDSLKVAEMLSLGQGTHPVDSDDSDAVRAPLGRQVL